MRGNIVRRHLDRTDAKCNVTTWLRFGHGVFCGLTNNIGFFIKRHNFCIADTREMNSTFLTIIRQLIVQGKTEKPQMPKVLSVY
jgi:hypothetical protein